MVYNQKQILIVQFLMNHYLNQNKDLKNVYIYKILYIAPISNIVAN